MNQVVEYVQNGLALVPIPLGSKGPDKPGWNLSENAITTINGAESITGNAVKSAIKTVIKLGMEHMELIRQAASEMAEEG